MEQNIIIRLSAEELRQLIEQTVSNLFDNKILTILPEQKKYLTRQEVAERFHVTLATIHTWINTGKIKALKIGRRTLFDQAEVENATSPKYKRS